MQKATRQQLKEQNRDLVLKILFESARISRAEIARMTGLTRTTVSDIITDLIEGGLVSEVGTGVSIGGKSPIMLSLVDDSRLMIGLDLAYNQFRGAVVDLRGQIRHMVTLPVNDYNGERAIEATFKVLDQLVQPPYQSVIGIGVGAPGLVNSKEGIVVNAVNLEWQNLPLKQILQQRYNLPVTVLNDCQAAAMGEFIFGGNTPPSRNMIVVRAGHGIGTGVIIDGTIFQGDSGGAGEIGHVVMVRSGGIPCRCGNSGCLETLASARAVLQRAERLMNKGIKTCLAPIPGGLSQDQMIEAYQAGDELAQQVINEAGYYLGLAISSLVSTLNIHCIILMGEMTRYGQPWLEEVRRTMERSTLTLLGRDTHIQIGALRDNDVILGASAQFSGNYGLLLKSAPLEVLVR
jgi:N-acetylglucosamine repressor